jgi:predicted Zn-dependent protease
MVLFVEHRGAVLQLLGYAPEGAWAGRQAAVQGALRSFEPLTDPAALNVQPQRLTILKLDRRTTMEALAGERSSPASAATLAIMNQVELQTPLESGRLVKWVVGPVQPGGGQPEG